MNNLSETKILHLCYNTKNTEQQGQILFCLQETVAGFTQLRKI